MDFSSGHFAGSNEPRFQAARTFLAYSVLLTGLVGTLSVAPLAIWALTSVGFR
ncbi:hypothetical protein [Hansschlegelia zhihuaiae]|uniref:hypothetical protein n=1 Tax=Hansschlegelia zhihuaiae TaxID=405005 RepID=UPI0013E8ED48|nr:hypothetical protein [Hansschlegelia zhihuaiae]